MMIDWDKESDFFEKLGSEIDDLLFLAKGFLGFTLALIGHLIYSAYYYTVGKCIAAALFHRNRRAAARGNARAQCDLGVMYAKGLGVAQNDAEAVRWYRKATEHGCAAAQNNLGAMYNHGKGVTQDDAEATRWYRKAADQGYAAAQVNLGLCYDQGRGVPQDYVEAHMWLNLAASRAGGDARKEFKKERELVAKQMTAEQLAEAQRRAREWKPKSGENKSGRPMK